VTAPRAAAAAWGGLGARERRTLAWGGVVVAAALFATYVALPFADRWGAREAATAARAAQLARVRGLAAAEPALASAVRLRERRAAEAGRGPLSAATPALAGAALQAALQQAAVLAGVQVQRVDVAQDDAGAEPAADGSASEVPATMTALGDVHGLAALLDALQRGPTLLEVTSLGAQATVGARGESLLQLTVGVRAPWVASGAPAGAP
jgi:type II secretory pathway component PulM